LIVASRPGQRLDDLKSALPEGLAIEAATGTEVSASGIELRSYRLHDAQGQTAPFYLLPGLEIEISASEIREQVGEILGTRRAGCELLPEAVSEYIREHLLYL
jgi:nicotinate-nucleotide adenylyltransferase